MNRILRCLSVFFALALLALPAAAQAGSWLLVLNKAENTMSIVDTQSLQVVAKVPTGEGPHEAAVSADGKLAFVCNYGAQKPGSSITVVDLDARKPVKTIDLGALRRPHGIVERGGKLYITAEGNRAVFRLDVATQQVDWLMGSGQAVTHMVVLTPDGKKLYTANIGSDNITRMLIDPPPPTPGSGPVMMVQQIATGKGPEGIDISPDGKELWVANRADGTISIVDPATDQVKETIPKFGKVPIRVKFTPDGKKVLVSDAEEGELIIFDAATRKVEKRIPTGVASVGVQVSPDGKRAFVASMQAGKVTEVNLETMSAGRTFETGAQPDGMAWVGK